MSIVTHQDLTVLNSTAPNCSAFNMLIYDTGRKLNTKRSNIIKHDLASFISFRFFFFFVADFSPAIALYLVGFGKNVFFAARKILI